VELGALDPASFFLLLEDGAFAPGFPPPRVDEDVAKLVCLEPLKALLGVREELVPAVGALLDFVLSGSSDRLLGLPMLDEDDDDNDDCQY
jgi:hypothetical protein